MRVKVFSILVTILLLNVVGCGKVTDGKTHGSHAVRALMDSAEAVMNDDPEYAFRLMDSIDSHLIRSRALQARYALLYTEAQYKNYIDETNDSLIMIAVRYYTGHNDITSRFLSFYYLGCIYYNVHSFSEAAVALGQAEELIDKIEDGYRLGLLYTQLGMVFYNTYDFHRAEQYYSKAYDNYIKADKQAHGIHALFDIGECKIQLKEYGAAHSLFQETERWAESQKDYYLLSSCILNELLCSLNCNLKDQAKKEIDKYIELFGYPKYKPFELSLFAKYYIMNGDYDNAIQFIDKGWKKSQNITDSIQICYSESLLKEYQGKLDTALIQYKHTIELQNQNIYNLLDQPVLGAQKDYFRNLAETESIRASRNRRTIVSLTIVFLLIVSSIILKSRIRRLQFESYKTDLLLTIRELKLKEDSNNETINRLSHRVNNLFSRPYEELDRIFEKIMETDDLIEIQSNVQLGKNKEEYYYKKIDEFYKHIKDKFDEIISDKNQIELDKIINSTYNDLMIRLADKNLHLTKQDLIILRLSIIGFSPKTIGRLTNTQYKTVYQQRRRAIQKITNYSPEIASYVLNVLKMN